MLFIPYKADVPMRRWPIANVAILGGMLLAFIWERMASVSQLAPYVLADWSFRGLVGHLWLHVGPIHLVGNMVFLWTFGNAVCAKVSNVFYPLVFVGLGVVAGAVHLIFNGEPAVGASGAINGIIGMYLVLYPLNRVSVLVAVFFWYWRLVSTSGFWMILLWFVFDILGVVFGFGGTAYWAHIGGFIAGSVLAAGLLLTGCVKIDPDETSLLQILHIMGGASEDLPLARAGESRAAPSAEPTDPVLKPERFLLLACTCGKTLRVPERLSGKTIGCPVCGQPILVRDTSHSGP
jgi:membrane associated rhomboid family serine protease